MADSAETLVGVVAPHVQTTGTGLKCGAYTFTIAAQNDTVTFSDFTKVVNCNVSIVASGVLNAATISGTTLNQIVCTSATTGAMRAIVWGY